MGVDLGSKRSGLSGDLPLDLRRQILIGKIDRRLEMRQKAQQARTPAAVERAKPPIELPQRLPPLRLGLGRDQIGDRFGLSQIQLAVEKSTTGELARLRKAQSHPPVRRDQCREHSAAAMYLKFSDIFACRAVWRWKPQRDAVVDILSAFRVTQPHVPGPAGRQQAPGERGKHFAGARPAYTDDGDRRLTRRGRRGKDRVGDGGRRRRQLQCFGGS